MYWPHEYLHIEINIAFNWLDNCSADRLFNIQHVIVLSGKAHRLKKISLSFYGIFLILCKCCVDSLGLFVPHLWQLLSFLFYGQDCKAVGSQQVIRVSVYNDVSGNLSVFCRFVQ